MVQGEPIWRVAQPNAWDLEIARFFAALKALDDALASAQTEKVDLPRIFQGLIADALTHMGQLAMLRRLGACPMKGESYAPADIVIGRVGYEQTPANPKYEFD
jgi:hypothetical protein